MTPEQIKTLRHDLGRTKEGMAKIVGTTTTNINRWETGATTPPSVVLAKLEKLRKWARWREEE